MTTNTQGPWRTDAAAGFPLDIHDHDNVLVARVQPFPAAHNVSRRIVACVNACEGMTTDTLEVAPGYKDAIDGFHEQRALVMQARAERDQLLAALEDVVSAWEKGDDVFGGVQRARAAVAAVNGGAA